MDPSGMGPPSWEASAADAKRYKTAAYGWESTGDPPLKFSVTRKYNRTTALFRGQKVVLSDAFGSSKDYDLRKNGYVKIVINGHDYTQHSLVEVRPAETDANRYWMQVMIAELTDTVTGQTRLAIVQSMPSFEEANMQLDNMSCRLLLLDDHGGVTKEMFKFGQRFKPAYRAPLAYYVSPLH